MISKRCSDVVESPVEHAILDTESRRNVCFYFRFWNSPCALAFMASHGLDDDPVCRVLLPKYFYGNWRAKVPNMLR